VEQADLPVTFLVQLLRRVPESLCSHRLQCVAQAFVPVRTPDSLACGLCHPISGNHDPLGQLDVSASVSGTGQRSPVLRCKVALQGAPPHSHFETPTIPFTISYRCGNLARDGIKAPQRTRMRRTRLTQAARRTTPSTSPDLARKSSPHSYARISRKSATERISNRHLGRLETDVTSRKQKAGTHSNRH
jgi:hypothetical protein